MTIMSKKNLKEEKKENLKIRKIKHGETDLDRKWCTRVAVLESKIPHGLNVARGHKSRFFFFFYSLTWEKNDTLTHVLLMCTSINI